MGGQINFPWYKALNFGERTKIIVSDQASQNPAPKMRGDGLERLAKNEDLRSARPHPCTPCSDCVSLGKIHTLSVKSDNKTML
jgi:hypothetical protein